MATWLLLPAACSSAVTAWLAQDVAASQRHLRHLLDICSRACDADPSGAQAAQQAHGSGSACMQLELRAALALALRAAVLRASQLLPGLDLRPVSRALAATACVMVCSPAL